MYSKHSRIHVVKRLNLELIEPKWYWKLTLWVLKRQKNKLYLDLDSSILPLQCTLSLQLFVFYLVLLPRYLMERQSLKIPRLSIASVLSKNRIYSYFRATLPCRTSRNTLGAFLWPLLFHMLFAIFSQNKLVPYFLFKSSKICTSRMLQDALNNGQSRKYFCLEKS